MTYQTISEAPEESRPYSPTPVYAEFMYSRDRECLLSGGMGTGKSRCCLELLYLYVTKYPGTRALIARKTRKSLTEAALVTWEQNVVPANHPCLRGAGRANRHSYDMGNGSVVVVGGMDKADKVLSTEWDLIYCVTGETLVDSPSRIEKGFRRPYSGKLVTIKTAGGNELTGTPNHPVLTDQGWVALGELDLGGYVVSRRLGQRQGSVPDPDVQNEPTAIADVFRALHALFPGSAERVKTVPMDFHGDGGHGDVDVVTAARKFHRWGQPTVYQPGVEGDGERGDFQAQRLVGGRSLAEVFLRVLPAAVPFGGPTPELSHSLAVGLRAAPSFGGALAGDGEVLLPYGIDPHPGLPLGEGLRRGFPRDPSFCHLLLESPDTDVYGLGDVRESRLPGDVALDRIVHVSVRDAGPGSHVYNLQTADSWYYAGNIVTHNCQEAVDLDLDDWEKLSGRLRNAKGPYRRMIADTNPAGGSHWLKNREQAGKLRILYTQLEDNPAMWQGGRWTALGREYVQTLDAMTGVRYERMRHGKWVQAEGVVYDGWNPRHHLVDWFPIPESWPRYLAIDFGYTDPFVAHWYAKDEDGRLYLYRQLCHTGRLVEDHARQILALSADEPSPVAIICDHDAEGRATLQRHLGTATVPARKAITRGIEYVQSRLRVQGDGRPRLMVLRDSLVERDQSMKSRGLPCSIEEEIDAYVWNPKKPDEPIDKDNHNCDAVRYACSHLDWHIRGDVKFAPLRPTPPGLEERLAESQGRWKPVVAGVPEKPSPVQHRPLGRQGGHRPFGVG